MYSPINHDEACLQASIKQCDTLNSPNKQIRNILEWGNTLVVYFDFYHLQGVVTLPRTTIRASKTFSFIWVSVEACTLPWCKC